MSLLKRNIVANFAGQGWTALMALAFVPLYIKFLGIEAYGLIGFYAMLQASFQVLDLGLSQTMSREMARYSVLPDKASEARDFVRTLEVGYWAVGIAIGVGLTAVAPIIAGHWIKPGTIPVKTVEHAVMIMGVVTALQWPISFYDGGLMGLQKQVLSNSIKIGMATLSNCGAAFILWKVSPTITAFFTWQIIVSALSVSLFIVFLWRSLPPAEGSPNFNFSLLRRIWRFAAGMTGISISAVILSQLDKIILSKMLSLEVFGYYVLAGIVCSVIPNMLVGPIFNAIFPRFSTLAVLEDKESLKHQYHQTSQLIAVLVLSVSLVIALFSADILRLWTGNEETARMTAPLVSILILGMTLNGLMSIPYALQLAHGWTSLSLRITFFLIIFIAPIIVLAANRFGAMGAATVWVVMNMINLSFGIILTHRRLLVGEAWTWLHKDIVPPLVIALIMVGLARLTFISPMTSMKAIAFLPSIFIVTLASTACAAPYVRSWLMLKLFRKTSIHSQLL